MFLDIYHAIENRRLIQMCYRDYYRVVEPRLYGSDAHGVDVLQAYQVAGCDELEGYSGWKWFEARDIAGITVLSTRFPLHRPDPATAGRAIRRIYCRVMDAAVGVPLAENQEHRRR